ncbi:MAG: glycosyltransferase family 4 protein [Flavobacteriales bacterium]
MKKILFIAAHRPNRSPSQRFRFEQYFTYLELQGFSCDLSYLLDEKDDRAFYAPGNVWRKAGIVWKSYKVRKKNIRESTKYDVVFIQREAFMTGSSYFEKQLKRKGPVVVFDFDDAIWKMDVSDGNSMFKWLKKPSKTEKLISLANVIIAGNAYLASYASQFNSHVNVIPTTVDTDIFKKNGHINTQTNKPVVIGWSGSLTTIKHVEMIVPVLERIKQKYGERVSFLLIGDHRFSNRLPGFTVKEWDLATEVEDLSAIDIGIMPLPNDEWSKGKCGLKGLTYMSLEIPTIMSAVGVNTEIIQHGVNGLLAANLDEWFSHLCSLIDNADLRKSLGAAGRKTVVEKYSVLANRDKYLKIFKECTKS